jgi:RNA-directed DNA polymerase
MEILLLHPELSTFSMQVHHRLVSSPKAQFRWRNPEENPYIFRSETRRTVTSHYHDVAMAMGQA